MRLLTILFLLTLSPSQAEQDLYFRIYQSKGLMLRLVEFGGLGIPGVEVSKRVPDPFGGKPDPRFREGGVVRTIDMLPFFTRYGVAFPKGSVCIFNPSKSIIVARTSKEAHSRIESICTTRLFEDREILDVLKTYLLTLKPLTEEKRWKFLQDYSYYPDDLLRALLHRHNRLERLAVSPEDKLQTKALRRVILDLLKLSLVRLEEQIKLAEPIIRGN